MDHGCDVVVSMVRPQELKQMQILELKREIIAVDIRSLVHIDQLHLPFFHK